MAAAINQSQQDCFSAIDKDSNSGQVAEQLSQDNENSSMGQVLKKVIPGGYRTKLSFNTPLQRGSNNSNFIKYQNSLASESVERKKIQNLGLGPPAQLSSIQDRSFSIQPQYRMMHKRLDELSRGSSLERINDVYQTLPIEQQRGADKDISESSQHLNKSQNRNSTRQDSREAAGSSHQHKARILRSRQRAVDNPHQGVDSVYLQKRGLRSPFDNKRQRGPNQQETSNEQNHNAVAHHNLIGNVIEKNQTPLKVPGILMDSINSQKLRSKSTFRGNQVGYGGNKLTSLQTMAHTSDQQYSSAAGGIMGLASIQSYSHHAGNNRDYHQKTNMDRCALLEEIEKSKVEEIKQKTLKNFDKYSKQKAVFNATNMNKFTNAPTMNYVPMMNATLGSQGNSSAKVGNPFARSASKNGSRSNAKSRGAGISTKESQISKNSFEKVGNDSMVMEKLNQQLRERDISPQKFSLGRDSMLDKSPILVQQYSGGADTGQNFNTDNSRTSNFTRITTGGIFKHESIQGTTMNSALGVNGTQQLGSSIEASQMKRKLNRNTINLAKLSLVLKNKNQLNGVPSRQQNGQTGETSILHQRERMNSIANILNETLSKLKKPNTHVLQPLDQTYAIGGVNFQQPQQQLLNQQRKTNGEESQLSSLKNSNNKVVLPQPRNSRLSLLDIVGGIRQSIQGVTTAAGVARNSTESGGGPELRNRSQSPSGGQPGGPDGGDKSTDDGQAIIPEEEVELDLDDLTQEDKFYLIQQIEAVQKNIRYYSSNQETYVFQDFDEGTQPGAESSKDSVTSLKPSGTQTANFSRYTNNENMTSPTSQQHSQQQDTFGDRINTSNSGTGIYRNDPRESPKITKHQEKLSLPSSRHLSLGKKTGVNSPPGDHSRNSYNANNAISFVTSALGLLAQESLEIIEDADEVEEDELDHINLCEQQSPTRIPINEDEFSPMHLQQSEDPPSPSNYPPFKHGARMKRRTLNEGQKQILSKGDLKRYKGGEEDPNAISDQQLDGGEGPEEVSVLLHRGSRVVKDFDMLRFSKASSIEQNFLVDVDHDSRMGLYPQQSSTSKQINQQNTVENSMERQARNASGQRSPMSIRRTPSQLKKAGMGNLRKLTNSLFEDGVGLTEQCNVIKEENENEKEQ